MYLILVNVQGPGAKPKLVVQTTIDELPTFHDAIVRMLFKVYFIAFRNDLYRDRKCVMNCLRHAYQFSVENRYICIPEFHSI